MTKIKLTAKAENQLYACLNRLWDIADSEETPSHIGGDIRLAATIINNILFGGPSDWEQKQINHYSARAEVIKAANQDENFQRWADSFGPEARAYIQEFLNKGN